MADTGSITLFRMRDKTMNVALEVKESPGKGRGVFASVPIPAQCCIERSPVIVIPEEQIVHIRRTELGNYYFRWGKDAAIALGLGSLFNHSYRPNAVFYPNLKEGVVEFYSLHPISQGEEITVNYNGDPADQSRLWFNTID